MSQMEFEKPILELEGKIRELKNVANDESNINLGDEIIKLQNKTEKLLKQTYSKLNPAQKVQVARHPERPHFKDYIGALIDDYTELSGDRNFADDQALLGGIGRFRGQTCIVFGHEKGHDTESRIKHNFGMARPEGYRKAQKLMKMAEQFKIPVISLIDTAGAYPGVGAEERGQAEAIAKSIETCLRLKVPMISIIIGEGGSGGAIAIAAADKVLMLEHSIYSIISPEGCASILWRSSKHSKEAATALKLTSKDLDKLKLIDGIIEEPLGGAHRNKEQTMISVGDEIEKLLAILMDKSPEELKSDRQAKFLAMGRNI